MSKTILGIGLILFSVSALAPAQAEEEESTESRREYTRQLRVSVPLDHDFYAQYPEGFDQKHFHAPYELSYRFERTPDEKNAGVFFDSVLGVPYYGTTAFIAAGGGAKFTVGSVVLGFGGGINHQALPSDGPVGNSYLDHWGGYVLGLFEYPLPGFTPFLDVGLINRFSATVSEQEGLETKIDWATTWRYRPGVRAEFSLLRLEAAVSFHDLGSVAIASKEFAHTIKGQMAYRPEVGVGVALNRLEIWARGSWTSFDRENDPVGFSYQAPDYLEDYMMANRVLRGEIRWNF